MRKVVVARAGGYERLAIESAPDPSPQADEIVVRAAGIGVNFADCIVRMGLYESAKKYVGWPITPGFEVAGTVVARGERVRDVAIGAEVVAVTRFGGYATHVAVPRDQAFALPRGFSLVEAAGFPAVFLTAHYALFELANLPREVDENDRPRVLVHSAAGGVGGALVQLARAAGARVVGVVGASDKVDAVRALGGDAVIDKSREDLWRAARRHAPDGYDVVLDANGVETLRESYRHLGSPGKLVVYGFHTMFERGGRGKPRWGKLAKDWLRTPRFDPLRMTGDNKSVLAFNLSYLFEKKRFLTRAMDDLSALAAAGKVRPLPTTPFPFDRVADAHRALESGRTIGKLVLVP